MSWKDWPKWVKIVLIILLILLIFIMFFAIFIFDIVGDFRHAQFEKKSMKNYQYPKGFPAPGCDGVFKCQANLAIEHNDIRFCNNITGFERYEWCYRDFAKGTKNESVCDIIPYALARDYCFRDMASTLEKPDLCDRVMTRLDRGLCYYMTVYVTKDKTLCKKIPFFTYDIMGVGNLRKACSRI